MPLQDNIGSVVRSGTSYPNDSYGMGFIDPVTATIVVTAAVNFIKKFANTDKVPNYPVKSQNTFNSLVASIAAIIPLPPQSVADAKRLLQITYDERVKAVARGTDRATLTVIMLLDEIIVSLQNYITLKGGTVPVPGTDPLTAPRPDPLTAGSFFSNPMVLITAGVGIYFLTRKKRRVSGSNETLPIVLGAGALLLLLKKKSSYRIVTNYEYDSETGTWGDVKYKYDAGTDTYIRV